MKKGNKNENKTKSIDSVQNDIVSLSECENYANAGKYNKKSDGKSCSSFPELTVRNLMADWLISVSPKIKPSTYAKYDSMIRLHINPYLGPVLLSEIDQNLIDRFIFLMLTEGRDKCMPSGSCCILSETVRSEKSNMVDSKVSGQSGLSAKSVSDIVSILKNALKYAQRRSSLSFDLCFDVSKKQRSDIRVFTSDEKKRLCEYLSENPSLKNLGIFICLFTGLRIGEICALRRENISFEDRVLHVEKTMQRLPASVFRNKSEDGVEFCFRNREQNPDSDKTGNASVSPKTVVVITTPKSDCSKRVIPLPDFLVSELRKHCGNFPGNAFILTGSPDEFIEPRSYQHYFKKTLENCQIEDANFHALRHTFATTAVEIGFDVKCLSEILGHSSVNITLNRYVHPSMDAKRKCMEMMNIFDSK